MLPGGEGAYLRFKAVNSKRNHSAQSVFFSILIEPRDADARKVGRGEVSVWL